VEGEGTKLGEPGDVSRQPRQLVVVKAEGLEIDESEAE
jgi:hypothetical protein